MIISEQRRDSGHLLILIAVSSFGECLRRVHHRPGGGGFNLSYFQNG
jgi:hypothetical protein